MSLRGAITSLKTGSVYTVTRRAASTYVDGKLVAGATSTRTIVASIQPVSGRETLQFAESERTREMRAVFTEDELLARSSSNEPDIVTINGESFEVMRVEYWEAFGAFHSRAYVARVHSP